MNPQTAKKIHEVTNLSFWFENPEWRTGNPYGDLLVQAVRGGLPFSPYKLLRDGLFKPNILAVNGESVVADNGDGTVNKYMFRKPRNMSIEEFRDRVERETSLVARYLGGIALDTTVEIRTEDIFRHPLRPGSRPLVVTQRQPKLDLAQNPPFDLANLDDIKSDTTLRQLEKLLAGSRQLALENDGILPDISPTVTSGNLRVDSDTGQLTLLDVMPIYPNGNRLIGDNPPHAYDSSVESLKLIENRLRKAG